MRFVPVLGCTVLAALATTSCEHTRRDPRTAARALCSQLGQPSRPPVTVRVAGNPGSVRAPVEGLGAGDVVQVTATGRVHVGGVLGVHGEHGPEGAEPAPDDWPWPGRGLPKFSLLGSWNRTGGVFLAGADSGCQVHPPGGPPDAPAFLWLRVNDDGPLDNSGFFEAKVFVWDR